MANIHGMTDSLALVCRRPKPSVVAHANRAIYGLPEHAVVRQLLSVVQVGTNDWTPLNLILANGHSLKRTPSYFCACPRISNHMPL